MGATGGGVSSGETLGSALAVGCPDTSSDRWGWALGSGDFQVGDPPTLGS
jgi:hypothetical protein